MKVRIVTENPQKSKIKEKEIRDEAGQGRAGAEEDKYFFIYSSYYYYYYYY